MFLLSKKLMYLLIIATLVFGVDRCNAEEPTKCYVCDPCNVDGSNEKPDENCPNGDYACGAIKSGDTITKRCSKDENEWREAPGSHIPKEINGVECWCKDRGGCNAGPTYCGFNVDGGSGGNGTGTGGGGGGSSGGDIGDSLTSGAGGIIISPGLAILFWFL